MRPARFWIVLSGISLIVFTSLYWILQYPLFQAHIVLYTGMAALMIAFTIALYWGGILALRSSNRFSFIRLVMAGVFLKILFTMSLFTVYYKGVLPEGKFFVFPFLGIYVIYTIFETMALFSVSQAHQKI